MGKEFKLKARFYDCLDELLWEIRRNKSYYSHKDVDEIGNEIYSPPTIEDDGDYNFTYYYAWDEIEKVFLNTFK